MDAITEGATMKELSKIEQDALRDCEEVIAKGMTNFRDVGEALMRIRDEKLFRQKFGTFEEYCQTTWDFGKRRANQIIAATKVELIESTPQKKSGKKISQSGDRDIENAVLQPSTDSQVRALSSLPESEQPAAWSEAVESAGGKQPTAKQVKEVVEKRTAKTETGLEGLIDSVREAIEQAEAFRELMSAITAIKSKVTKLVESPLGRHINPNELNAHLTNAFRILKFAMPFADCVYCGRTIKKTCKACGGQGWLVQDVFNQAPPDMKANSVVRKVG